MPGVPGTNGGDPTAASRIRAAATKAWGERSDASLDEIAAAAGVSRGTLDHHYPTEADLREAINEYLIAVAGRLFADAPTDDDQDFSAFGQIITKLIQDYGDEMRYVARGAIDGQPDGIAMFDAFMAIALDAFQKLDASGVLDPELDLDWAALHMVVFNLAVVLFQDAIANHLPEPISDEAGMHRWYLADTELFRHGYLHPEARYRPVTT